MDIELMKWLVVSELSDWSPNSSSLQGPEVPGNYLQVKQSAEKNPGTHSMQHEGIELYSKGWLYKQGMEEQESYSAQKCLSLGIQPFLLQLGIHQLKV